MSLRVEIFIDETREGNVSRVDVRSVVYDERATDLERKTSEGLAVAAKAEMERQGHKALAAQIVEFPT